MIKIIIATIAVAAILEGLIVALFPKDIKEILKHFSKSKKLRQIGIIELIIAGVVLVLLYLF